MLSGLFINSHGPYDYEYHDDTPEIDVSSLGNPRPDPEWFHIDEHGHFHAFNMEANSLPTLHHDEFGIPRCTLCNSPVKPHYLAVRIRTETITGPKSIRLTVPNYNRDIGHDDRVSFFTQAMFGIARVGGFSFTHFNEGVTISLTLACEFIAKRNNDL